MKKSLYIFLCSLLGMLMFLIIHRLLVFAYLLLISANPELFAGKMSYLELLALDFFSLIIALLLGAWYGIALGIKWYEAVYERREYEGFVDHFVRNYWPSPIRESHDLQAKVRNVARELKDDVLQLEHLAKTIKPIVRETTPIKRQIIRKKASPRKRAG